jgi:thymidylate synthase
VILSLLRLVSYETLQEGTGVDQSAYSGSADTFRGVLTTLQSAPQLEADGPDAGRLRRGSREHLNYSFTLADPRQRLAERLPLYAAVARVVWMMSANNRLADIAFHEPRVKAFTDDDLTVPGSSYGTRLRQPQPGLDQLLGAIGRLKNEADSRRAAVAIFQPVDAVRDSNDIPCAFGLFFHNRGGRLLTTVIMRSNNAFTLLPFNLFEFSLLAEVVSVEAGLEFGPITYFAGSMHLYDDDAGRAAEFLKTAAFIPPTMGPMPKEVSPLAQLTKLAQFEADLRHGSAAMNARNVQNWLDRAARELHPYWAELAFVLVSGLGARVDRRTLELASERVQADLKPFLPALAATVAAEPVGFGDLFEKSAPPPVLVPLHRTAVLKKFATLAVAYEQEIGMPIGAGKLLRAQGIVSERLAARGEADALTKEVFLQALEDAL